MIYIDRHCIKNLKSKFGLTSKDLAEILGISERHVINYENVNKDFILKIPLVHLITLYNKFNLPLDFFFESDGPFILKEDYINDSNKNAYKGKFLNILEEYYAYKSEKEKEIQELKEEIVKLKIKNA